MFRSPTEGNFIVGLLNISFTPNTQLGRLISNFSAQAYEVMEFNIENLKKYYIIETEDIKNEEQVITCIGQVAGFYDKNTNLLDVIANNITDQTYKFKELLDITIEIYPQLEFEKQKNYYLSFAEKTELETIIQLQNYFANITNQPQTIHISMGHSNIEFYNGVLLSNKKFYLDNLKLNQEFNDFIKILNDIPVIITYIATKVEKNIENYIEYSYEIMGYKQSRLQFVPNKTNRINNAYISNPNLLKYSYNNSGILEHNNWIYTNTNSIPETIFKIFIQDFAVQNNIVLPFSNIVQDKPILYEDQKYIIELVEIPWIEIETQENAKLILSDFGNSQNEKEELIVGKTDKLILENLLSYNKPNLLVTDTSIKQQNTFLINYSYQISILRKGE